MKNQIDPNSPEFLSLYMNVIDQIMDDKWEAVRECEWYDERFEMMCKACLPILGENGRPFLLGYIQGRAEGMMKERSRVKH